MQRKENVAKLREWMNWGKERSLKFIGHSISRKSAESRRKNDEGEDMPLRKVILDDSDE
jgi:hypothetical protein